MIKQKSQPTTTIYRWINPIGYAPVIHSTPPEPAPKKPGNTLDRLRNSDYTQNTINPTE